MNNSYKTSNFIYAAFFARRIISLVEVDSLNINFYAFFIEITIINEVRYALKNTKTPLNFRIKRIKCFYFKI